MNRETEYYTTDDLQVVATLLAFTSEKIISRKDLLNGKRQFALSGDPAKHEEIIKEVFSYRKPILICPSELFDCYAQLVREIKTSRNAYG